MASFRDEPDQSPCKDSGFGTNCDYKDAINQKPMKNGRAKTFGNTFPPVVFCCFGGFWLSYAATLTPAFNAYTPYAPTDATSEAQGLQETGFTATLAFWFVFMALLCFVFMMCALRTNVLFVVVFLLLSIALQLLAGAYWKMADGLVGNAEIANTLTVTAGAVLFVTGFVGWYLFAALMLASVDFPFSLPVGDLSEIVKGRQDKLEPRAAPDGEC